MEDEGGWHWEGGSAERDPPWSLFTATGACVFVEGCGLEMDMGGGVGMERGQRTLQHLFSG